MLDAIILGVDKKISMCGMYGNLSCRMYGNLGRQQHHTCYTDHLMSNLKFARRMKIVKKLDSHDGCVNALNFNQAGKLNMNSIFISYFCLREFLHKFIIPLLS